MHALRIVLVVSLVASIASAQTVPEPSAQPSAPAPTAAPVVAQPAGMDPELSALSEQRDALGRRCDLKAAFASGELRYVACGGAGVWIVRVRPGMPPVTLERRELDGDVIGFFVHNGHLWVQTASVQARRLVPVEGHPDAPGVQAPAPAPLPAPTGAAPAPTRPAVPVVQAVDAERPPREGVVIEAESDHVIVDLGSRDGLRDGARVALYERVQERLATGISSDRLELLAVGRVNGVAGDRARVMLGLNERVPTGAIARLSNEPLTAGSVAPPRVGNLWEVGFLARPFLVLENLGAGVFADLRVGYRTDYNVHYEAFVMPVAFAAAEEGQTFPAAAVITASYDSRLFEVGLGIGGQTVNDSAFDLEPGTGITALQRVRLGARDGLHLEGLFYVALFHSEFDFSSVRVNGQIPMSRGSWLIASGSGGSLGIGHGEIGLRMLLSGNGDRGSFFLTTTVGGVHVFESSLCFDRGFPCELPIDYAGPMVGVGGEWRL
jgi:hypothetical protein